MADPTASQTTAKEREIKEGLLKLCIDNSRDCFKEGQFSEALKNAKLALKHSKEVEDEKSRRLVSKPLALVFLELQDFGEALINGEEWLSHFEENDDTDEKHHAQWTMASAYHKRALNSLNNNQFKDALEQFDREPNMLSLKFDVEDYIKAGKIHRKMHRYDKAVFYFVEAKKDANSKLKKKKINKWIQEVNKEANESIQEDFKMEVNSDHWGVVLKLEHCFSRQWIWVNGLPSEGALNKVYNHKDSPKWQMRYFPKVYAIAFWHHCKTHYNDKLAEGENRKTVEEIHIELNKRFNILGRVFEAVCNFTRKVHDETIEDRYACNVKVKAIFWVCSLFMKW
ncbi:hypothetical protein K1719_018837 [Acacia pycnantha]|nr:hypothetical protein K1719_018837 [Acacia pycnantha]